MVFTRKDGIFMGELLVSGSVPGEMIQFNYYFSDGLTQPPTSWNKKARKNRFLGKWTSETWGRLPDSKLVQWKSLLKMKGNEYWRHPIFQPWLWEGGHLYLTNMRVFRWVLEKKQLAEHSWGKKPHWHLRIADHWICSNSNRVRGCTVAVQFFRSVFCIVASKKSPGEVFEKFAPWKSYRIIWKAQGSSNYFQACF